VYIPVFSDGGRITFSADSRMAWRMSSGVGQNRNIRRPCRSLKGASNARDTDPNPMQEILTSVIIGKKR
jgi:hypothetical protein